MLLREIVEQKERETLNPCAAKSGGDCKRARFEEECPVRTAFARDRDRVTHSKSFRRLMHKTQVFISPEGDHFRTRLTHTLEVAQISRTIARALSLNEDLTEAIALAHDLGHTPFGHAGEEALDRLVSGGFRHNEQSVRVVTLLEKGGKGLNLTREVIDGIEKHRLSTTPMTLEGAVVRISDKIAYINHDIDDAVRAGMLDPDDLPKEAVERLGETSSRRVNTLIMSVINESAGQNAIAMSDEGLKAMTSLRDFMYSTVYRNQLLTKEREKIYYMFGAMFEYFTKNPEMMPEDFTRLTERGEDVERVVCDHIACMTDRYALKIYIDFFVPSSGMK